MVLKGGTLKFLSQNQDTIKKNLKTILNDRNTSIKLIRKKYSRTTKEIVCVFKITFSADKAIYFSEDSSIHGIGNKVIILKFFVYSVKQINQDEPTKYGYDNDQYTREISIATILGGQTIADPICPSFLYEESIDMFHKAKPDSLVESITDFLLDIDEVVDFCLDSFNEEFRKIPGGKECTKFMALGGRLLFMEFFECCTLYEFRISQEAPPTSINGRRLLVPSSEVKLNGLFGLSIASFKTLVIHLMTLQLFASRCIHGDLHHKNVFIVSKEGDLKVKVIDFGRSKYWDKDTTMRTELQLDLDIDIYRVTTTTTRPRPRIESLLKLYETVKRKGPDVYTTIKQHIAHYEFIEASHIIGMCKALPEHNSPFFSYAKDPLYYSEMYYDIPLSELDAYNKIIEQCLDPITVDESLLKRTEPNGSGGSFYKNRINKFIVSKQINRKSKKRKNKTRNTKKSRKITMKKRIAKTKK